MLSTEDLTKQVKLIAQNAWRQETNTTVNSIVEYVVREALLLLNEDFNTQINEMQTAVIALAEQLESLSEQGLIINASTNGGVSQPQRDSQAQDKGSRGTSKARTTDAANVA